MTQHTCPLQHDTTHLSTTTLPYTCPLQHYHTPVHYNTTIHLYCHIIQQFKKALHNIQTDVNSRNESGVALIHSLVERVFSDKRERSEFLLTLLTYSSANINLTNGNQMTALHLVAQVIVCVDMCVWM